MGTAQQRWADQLAAWTIDPEILAAAPESPYGFPTGLFGTQSGAESTHRAIRSALPDGGILLDIGCGGGAASIPVAARAGSLLGVDTSGAMLAAFTEAARVSGTPTMTWQGVWADVAADVPVADVAVAANVVYNVPDIGNFLQTVTAHARCRVVIELTDTHPWTGLAALWRHFHHQDRPRGPTTADFLAVTAELGFETGVESFRRTAVWASASPEVVLAFNRRRLCLPAGRESEVAAAMREHAPARPRRPALCGGIPDSLASHPCRLACPAHEKPELIEGSRRLVSMSCPSPSQSTSGSAICVRPSAYLSVKGACVLRSGVWSDVPTAT